MGHDIIHLLPDNIANQIAAGEVIQRPASVVKELVENALDAQAKTIRIEILDAGKELIRIIDDGVGMTQSDARMAFERHATSKITKVNDLFSLKTMGFRGEALASIAAVAQVELITKTKDQELGTKLHISASEVLSSELCTASQGCVFSVRNLFFNVPARRKFLRSSDTEQKNIIQEIEHIVLVHPEVTFEVYFDNKLHYILPASKHKIRILDTLGKRYEKDMIPINQKFPFGTIDGFIGKPEGARKRGAKQFFFVNGRFMKHPYFHKAITKTYEPFLRTGEQPNYFVYFNVDPQTIDVNIHPTKTEIKFENEQVIFKFLESMIRDGLASSHAVPTIDFNVEHLVDIPAYTGPQEGQLEMPPVDVDTSYNPFDVDPVAVDPSQGMDGTPGVGGTAISDVSWSNLLNNFKDNKRAKDKVSKVSSPLVETKKIVSKVSALSYDDDHPSSTSYNVSSERLDIPAQTSVQKSVVRVSKANLQLSDPLFDSDEGIRDSQPVFVYKRRFLTYERESSLTLIDFRRAHIRVLYDQFMEDRDLNGLEQQQLLFPEQLNFAETTNLDWVIDHLAKIGFEIEKLDDDTYHLIATPASIESSQAASIVVSSVDAILQGEESELSAKLDEMIAMKMAEARAWAYGRYITRIEANKLFSDLFKCKNFNYTPDGKLIILDIEEDMIFKKFGTR